VTDARLLGAADVRALASRLDLRPTKQRGQNFVIDANTVRRIVAAADLRGGDHVLEVGPGLGSLTLGLLPSAASVTAVEVDPVLAAALPSTAAAFARRETDRLTVLQADALALRADDPRLPGEPPTALVANLPYNVAVPVLLHLLAEFGSIERVLVMVQLEVADRLAADPGTKVYGVPSVKASWFGETRRVGLIGRAVFWPVPNVDSGLVSIVRRPPPQTSVSRGAVFAVVDAAFAQRRKTLRAALSGIAGSPSRAEAALRAANVDPGLRGERLGVSDFVRVAEALATAP
jgi:16S rRNA (adenine1518-N6/adenine1519-N6)-dimethyltransferase